MVDGEVKAVAERRRSFLEGVDHAPDIRPEVLTSWKRSAFCSVSTAEAEPPFDSALMPDERLLSAASTVLTDTVDRLGDLGIAFIVSDAEARILQCWTMTPQLLRRLDAVRATPGAVYAEDAIGTNAIGTTVETGRSSRFDGFEHYADPFTRFTCVGVPIRDPLRGRMRGVLDVTTSADQHNRLITLVTHQIARAIEACLAGPALLADRALLERFSSERRHSTGVAALNSRVLMTDARAGRLLAGLNQADLWEHVAEVMDGSRTVAREFVTPSGRFVHTTASLLSWDGQAQGVLLKVHEPAPSPRPAIRPVRLHATKSGSALPGGSPYHTHSWNSALSSFESSTPLLLRGEPGTGKTTMAQALHAAAGHGSFCVIDASSIAVDGIDGWFTGLRTTLAGEPGTILIRHVELLAPSLARAVGRVVQHGVGLSWNCVLTETPDSPYDGDGGRLGELELTTVTVPPLRARTSDFAMLVEKLAAPKWISPEAVQLLQRMPWPGNIRQLRTVIERLRDQSRTSVLGLSDIPDELRARAVRKNLSRFEKAEVQAIFDALAETAGNREKASALLGISRSTLYRKLKAAGVDLDRTMF